MARPRGRIALILLPVLVYLFLLSPVFNSELVFTPAWAVKVDEAPVQNGGDSSLTLKKEVKDLIPFKLDRIFGYISPDGTLQFRDTVLYNTLVNNYGFINYSNVSENLVLRNPDGSILSSFRTSGYPVILEGNRVIVIDTSRSSLKELDFSGTEKWKRDFPIIITSIGGNGSLLFVGRADGNAELLDGNGALVYQWKTEGTRISIVYACAVSESGNYLAVIAGIDPQKLVLLEKKDAAYRPVMTQILDSSFRRAVNLQFSGADRYLFFEDSEKLWCYDLEKKQEFSQVAGVRSLQVLEDPQNPLFFHIYSIPEHRVFQIFSRTGYTLTQMIIDETSFLDVLPGTLYLGEGGTLMRLNIGHN
ncbi:MAG: hypothetical protein E4H36_02535 [Spirochaetales bacterium]|nr:MAG: hypothetical protein E4H36_02535 [Spirochaetales bacterium]